MSDVTAIAPTIHPEAAAPPVRNSAGVAGVASEPIQFVSFAIGDDQYGVDIMAVREIKEWSAITPLPNQPDYVRGVLNLRGAIVPIIDLRCRFGQGATTATALHIVIIVQTGERPVGLLADRVLDIVAIEAARIKQVPAVAQGERLNFLSGLINLDAGMVALIDLPRLVGRHSVAPPAAAA